MCMLNIECYNTVILIEGVISQIFFLNSQVLAQFLVQSRSSVNVSMN